MDDETPGPYFGPYHRGTDFLESCQEHPAGQVDSSVITPGSYIGRYRLANYAQHHPSNNAIAQGGQNVSMTQHDSQSLTTVDDALSQSSVYPQPPLAPNQRMLATMPSDNVTSHGINRSTFISSIFESGAAEPDPRHKISGSEVDDFSKLVYQSDSSAAEPSLALSSRGTRGGRGRPRGRARGRSRGRGRPRSSKGDQQSRQISALSQPTHTMSTVDDDDRRGKSKRRRPVKAVEPSQLFKLSLQQATAAFMAKDFDNALEHARAAVKINPEIFAAHSLLSEILHEMGREADSVGALFSGAHVKREPQVWWHVIERTEQVPDITRQQKTDQIRYCLQRIIVLDPADYNCRMERLKLMLESRQTPQALRECIRMLKMRPHDSNVLRTAAQQAIILNSSPYNDRGEACRAMQKVFETRMEEYLVDEDNDRLNWSLVNIYLDILDSLKQYDEGCRRLKSLARWLCGREEEVFWDEYDDDREWDVDDEPRRIETPGFVKGNFAKASYGESLPLEFRVKLGTFRLHLGSHNQSEGFYHFSHLLSENGTPHVAVSEFDDLFMEAGDALRETGHYTRALSFYLLLVHHSEKLQASYYRSLSICYRNTGRRSKAIEALETVVSLECNDDEPTIELIKMFQEYGMHEAASRYIIKLCEESKMEKLKSSGVKYGRLAKLAGYANRVADSAHLDHLRKRTKNKELGFLSQDQDGYDSRENTVNSNPNQNEWKKKSPGKKQGKRQQTRPDGVGDYEVEEGHSEDGFVAKMGRRPQGGRCKNKKLATGSKHSERSADEMRDIQSRQAMQRLKNLEAAIGIRDETFVEEWMESASILINDIQGIKSWNLRKDNYARQAGSPVGDADQLAMTFPDKNGEMTSDVEDLGILEDHANDGKPKESCYEFRGATFDRWVDIFCQYAMHCAAEFSDRSRCYEILDWAMRSTVVCEGVQRIVRLHFCQLACAVFFSDEQVVIDQVRWFIKDNRSPYQQASDSFRLWNLTSRLFSGQRTWYNSGPSQKFILRYIKALDFALVDPDRRNTFGTAQERDNWTHSGSHDGNPQKLMEHDPSVLILYGHVLAVGGAYAQALNYYFRALALSPEDPVVSFSIASSYIRHALKRHSENRQYQLQQGLAFMLRYHELRTKENNAIYAQEAEFNLARTWHALGVLHLALPVYRGVLGMREIISLQSAEAAFAIRTILALGGDTIAARRVTEEWLTL